MASLSQKLAAHLAESRLLTTGRELYRRNERDWELPMNKWGKLKAGGYIILRDYADGLFPPRFEDQQKAYDAEKQYAVALPGLGQERIRALGMQKPFWTARALRSFMRGFIRLDGHEVDFAGEIAWAKAGAPHMSLRGRIGVRFTNLPPAVKQVLGEPAFRNVG